MRDLFQRLKGAGGQSAAQPTEPRLALGAFGKHPGWDDHILGIGVETETLAQVKQALYVGGIGSQIDSGAWEKLESGKRLAGYDHVFLWLRPGHLVLGVLWSSTDGKGRSKYPMVLCIDGEGVPAEFMLGTLLPGLDRLRDSCKATTSAEKVKENCRIAQEQLRAALGAAKTGGGTSTLSPAARQQFLQRGELGPDRTGLLRIFHEIGSLPGLVDSGRDAAVQAVASARSRHLRVPLAASSSGEALLCWAAFLRCAVPAAVPLLLLSRRGVDWLEVIVGEAGSDDFFCLQASVKAAPLASDIPYQLAPDARPRLQEIETAFLGVPPSVAPPLLETGKMLVTLAETGSTRVVPEATFPPKIAAIGPLAAESGGVPPVAAHQGAPAPPPATARGDAKRKSKLPYWAGGVAAVLFVLAVVMFSMGGRHSTPSPQVVIHPPAQPTKTVSAPVTPQVNSNAVRERAYKQAIAAAQDAQARKDYSNAMAQSEAALKSKPDDAAALKIVSESKTAIESLAAAAERERKYQAAMSAASTALRENKFEEAIRQADLALAGKSNDSSALQLKTQASQAMQTAAAAAAAAAQKQRKYQQALDSARSALQLTNYSLAISQASNALIILPNDSVAKAVMAQARSEAAAAAAQARYQSAMNAAQVAYDRKDFTNAVAQASQALQAKPSDIRATMFLANARKASEAAADVARKAALPEKKLDFTNSLSMEFVWIPSLGAYMGRYEVTQKQFRLLAEKLPEGQPGQGDDLPVVNLSYEDAKAFCERLSKKEQKRYALPSQQEWLIVAGISAEQINDAWNVLTSRGALQSEVLDARGPMPVGSRGAQTNGLCDLFGNVREWVSGGANGISAGFHYSVTGGRTKAVFLSGPFQASRDWQATATGFRCLLREGK
jgi:formylglycine-generating enzyme required for sulfatase activity